MLLSAKRDYLASPELQSSWGDPGSINIWSLRDRRLIFLYPVGRKASAASLPCPAQFVVPSQSFIESQRQTPPALRQSICFDEDGL
jgi:hypothetical protein